MKFETPEQLRGYLKSLPHLNDKGRSARTQKAQEDFYYAVKTYFPNNIDNIKFFMFAYIIKLYCLDKICISDFSEN